MNKYAKMMECYEPFDDEEILSNDVVIEQFDDEYEHYDYEKTALEELDNQETYIEIENDDDKLNNQKQYIDTENQTSIQVIEELEECDIDESDIKIPLTLEEVKNNQNNYLITKDIKKQLQRKKQKFMCDDRVYSDSDIIEDIITINKIYKKSLTEYDNSLLYKESIIKDLYCNIYGDFYKLKNNDKIKVSYINSNYKHKVIKYLGRLYDARRLLFDTFVCNSSNLELKYTKDLEYNINVLSNIMFKLK